MALFTNFEVKTFNSASLTVAYQVFGTPLTYPCYECVICNESNVPILISIDGINPIIRIGEGKTHTFKGMTRHETLDKAVFLFSEKTQLYISGTTGAGIITCNILMAR